MDFLSVNILKTIYVVLWKSKCALFSSNRVVICVYHNIGAIFISVDRLLTAEKYVSDILIWNSTESRYFPAVRQRTQKYQYCGELKYQPHLKLKRAWIFSCEIWFILNSALFIIVELMTYSTDNLTFRFQLNFQKTKGTLPTCTISFQINQIYEKKITLSLTFILAETIWNFMLTF